MTRSGRWHDADADETMPVVDELVRVYASGDAFAAELMRGRLEAEDIPVLMKGESGGPYRMGPCYLWVRGEDATRAKVIIDAVGSGVFAVTDEDVTPSDR